MEIENMEKTSVVFRSTHNSYRIHTDSNILTENGDELNVYDNDRFLEPGDTITYETDNLGITKVKAVRYKGNAEVKKKVFGEIGGQKNTGKQQADLQTALNMGFLEESTIKSGNGSYMLQPPEDLPF